MYIYVCVCPCIHNITKHTHIESVHHPITTNPLAATWPTTPTRRCKIWSCSSCASGIRPSTTARSWYAHSFFHSLIYIYIYHMCVDIYIYILYIRMFFGGGEKSVDTILLAFHCSIFFYMHQHYTREPTRCGMWRTRSASTPTSTPASRYNIYVYTLHVWSLLPARLHACTYIVPFHLHHTPPTNQYKTNTGPSPRVAARHRHGRRHGPQQQPQPQPQCGGTGGGGHGGGRHDRVAPLLAAVAGGGAAGG